ncbi:MAG: putative toxin-antitoxin system toxin component, PIN family [Alphaproteobacteria bacterium]
MRIVLDTDVVVAALRSPAGGSAAVLRAIRRGSATMLASVPLMIEYEAICQLAVHRRAAQLDAASVAIFLDAIAALSEPVETHFRWRPQLRDPGDEMVLETAVNGRASAVVTFNSRDYGSIPSTFGIDVWTPGQTLSRIGT